MKMYTTLELINNVCERGFRNAEKNRQKIRNCGFTDGERIPLFENYSMVLYGSHGGIRKVFYKKDREVRRETVLRNLVREMEK